MRHFARSLEQIGWKVRYVKISDPKNSGTLIGEMERAVTEERIFEILLTEPGEYLVKHQMLTWSAAQGRRLTLQEDSRFLTSHSEFEEWAADRKQLRMEYFYRQMRKKTGLLMKGSKPQGGRWNFDVENRKPAKSDLFMPSIHRVQSDDITREVRTIVEQMFPQNFGSLTPFWFAVTKADAEKALETFVEAALPNFGDYQDAMLTSEPFLYHSVLSLYINVGLLDPLSVCRKVEKAYYQG